MTDEERVESIIQIASSFGISCDDASYIVKSFENFGKEYMMSNIEDDVKVLENYLKELDDLFSRTHINNTKERNAIRNILSEREQDKARIKALEDKLQEINGYILTKGIDEPLKTATQIECEYQKQYIIQQEITRLKQYAKELMKEKQQLTTALLDSIPKQKVKDKIEKLKKDYDKKYDLFMGHKFQSKEQQDILKQMRILKELLEEGE